MPPYGSRLMATALWQPPYVKGQRTKDKDKALCLIPLYHLYLYELKVD